MFSSALKSWTSNISSNYKLSDSPTSISGPWKIFDAKGKSTGKTVSVFIFEKKSLDGQSSSFGSRSSTAILKRVHEDVIERLKKEASSLAKLRHPSILELVEPVEDTRNGGLMFATEHVTGSLAGLLQEKGDQDWSGGSRGRTSRHAGQGLDGGREGKIFEIDELEIQKGLLQIGKGLEFLHESAGLVHANLTPEAIFVNAKSDWKISGLGFSGKSEGTAVATSAVPLALSEMLNFDPRLPRSVQLNLDYTSPDFVMDNNATTSADMFSLGLLIISLYNSPHRSPLETNMSLSAYKRAFSSNSSMPTASNNFMCSNKLPQPVLHLLPRLITRRPAQRFSAREFQQAGYFDNILVSAIRFLESLPAKTPNEKSQFLRGIPRIINQFPKSVLEKKVLPALLEEMKDKDLISLILQNVFKIVHILPTSHKAFPERIIPKLREVFLPSSTSKAPSTERDNAKEAGLMVLLENIQAVADNTNGKEFKDDILPIINVAMESSTHSLVDASLATLPVILATLDFSTIKNEVFPIIATVFSKTSSLGIKIRGLEALQSLCGGTPGQDQDSDGLDGLGQVGKTPKTRSVVLDKYTIQEKVVPLLKAIKTKEPAVMIAALDVFKEIGKIADADFIAMDVLPILWTFSLGPLLNLQQFQAFMALIRSLSTRVEQEHTRKLQELSSTSTTVASRNDFMSFGPISHSNGIDDSTNGENSDFENLVFGRKTAASTSWEPPSAWNTSVSPQLSNMSMNSPTNSSSTAPTFSWSTPAASSSGPRMNNSLNSTAASSRAITPERILGSLSSLQPQPSLGASLSQPLQPLQPSSAGILQPTSTNPNPWASINTSPSNIWSSSSGSTIQNPSFPSNITSSQLGTQSNFSMNTQSQQASSLYSGFSIAPPPSSSSRQSSFTGGTGVGMAMGGMMNSMAAQQSQQQQQSQQNSQKQGMEKYESLL